MNMKSFDEKTVRLVDVATKIMINPATIENAAYLHIVLCQLGLPRSSLNDSSFTRTSGGASISISTPEDQKGDDSTPYGVIPRLILLHACSQATLKGSREIDICKTQTAFMKLINLNLSGGKNGIRNNFKSQFIKLSKAKFELFLYTNKKENYFSGNIFETEPYNIENGKWNRKIRLTEEFYNSLVVEKNNVPIDKRAVCCLQRSSLALDIYLMLTERLHRVVKNNYVVRWKKLREQFGQEYANNKSGRVNFKKAFSYALTQVKAVYPDAKVEIVKCGLKIGKSEPPIPKVI